MPEGDTLFRTARQLGRVLHEATITTSTSPDGRCEPDDLSGQQVTAVEARGKHLLIFLRNGKAIHSHLGMTGSWHIYRHPASWQKPVKRARLHLAIPGWDIVCFTPKTLEILTPNGLKRHPFLRNLGPDLLAHTVDIDQIAARVLQHPLTPIGEIVMNQTVACGIGNVYKSEILFLTQTDPLATVADLSRDKVQEIYALARRLLLRNLEGYPRRTRSGAGTKLWVYGRSGLPCLKCGSHISMWRQGDLGRSTYFCPTCQRCRAGASAAQATN